jgi:hypothetical protein
MTLKDQLITDIKTILLNTNDFADTFTNARTATNINVIFDKEFAVVVDDVESSAPTLIVSDVDIPGIQHGDLFTNIADSIVYRVAGIQPDGTGITLVILSLV